MTRLITCIFLLLSASAFAAETDCTDIVQKLSAEGVLCNLERAASVQATANFEMHKDTAESGLYEQMRMAAAQAHLKCFARSNAVCSAK